ncbi:MAG: pentapeptide repeat-containing protein [Leptolyngbyaceae cyanobacterium]
MLALGNLPDDRVTPLLVDLIAQTDDLLWLDALQQALVARGAEAFPHLRRLNQGLAADLRMQGEPTRHYTTLIRLQTTNRILTKLVMLEEGDRDLPLDLTRMNLGFIQGGDGEFRLVLKNQDLAGIQWQGSVLTQAQLQGARFYSLGADNHPDTYDDRVTNFSGADLSDANLSGADLTLSQLVNAGLLRTNFNRADLTLANLSGANLEHASLIQTVLDQAILADARLSKADLTEAQLSAANLAGARLAEVNAAGSTLIEANLQGVSAPAAVLTDADLSGANLSSADLTGVTLQGANLRDADLRGTSLRDADLRGIRLQGANLNQVDFAGALFTNPTGGAGDGFVAAVPDLSQGDQYQGVDFSGGQNLDAA